MSGSQPLNENEYSLTRNSAGQSVLLPYALYGQILQTQGPPDRTTARRAQVALRVTF